MEYAGLALTGLRTRQESESEGATMCVPRAGEARVGGEGPGVGASPRLVSGRLFLRK